MTEDNEAFLQAVAILVDERGYHSMSEEELGHLGEQALLDVMAVYAALGMEARKWFASVAAERLGPYLLAQ